MKLLILALAIGLTAPSAAVAESRRDRERQAEVSVSRDAALAIAQKNGLARLREAKLRDGLWKFEGWNAAGAEIEVEISAGAGEVVKVETGPSRHGGRHR